MGVELLRREVELAHVATHPGVSRNCAPVSTRLWIKRTTCVPVNTCSPRAPHDLFSSAVVFNFCMLHHVVPEILSSDKPTCLDVCHSSHPLFIYLPSVFSPYPHIFCFNAFQETAVAGSKMFRMFLPLAVVLSVLQAGATHAAASSASEMDPYKILGVTTSASQAEIKKVYKRLAKEW